MNLQASVELNCGGPGSGRHPGSGASKRDAMHEMLKTAGFDKVGKNRYESDRGHKVEVNDRGMWKHEDHKGFETSGAGVGTLADYLSNGVRAGGVGSGRKKEGSLKVGFEVKPGFAKSGNGKAYSIVRNFNWITSYGHKSKASAAKTIPSGDHRKFTIVKHDTGASKASIMQKAWDEDSW